LYDAIVLGSGPGGYVCALKMAKLGMKVVVVEKGEIGGTCTNRGCISMKALLSVADLYNAVASKASRFGIAVENVSPTPKLFDHMRRSVLMSRKGIEYLLKKNGVDVKRGEGILEDAGRVRVVNGREEVVEAKTLIVATGSQPVLFPPFDSVDGIWTSDDYFKDPVLPASVLIVGGGVIGVEFSTFFSAFGVNVVLVEMMERILPSEDEDISAVIHERLKKSGVKIFTGSKVTKLEKRGRGYKVWIESEGMEREIEIERILLAVGRKPSLPGGIEKLGLKINGGLGTDSTMRTDVEGVYAIGDVKGRIMLAHVAMREGVVAAHNVAGHIVEMDYSAVPMVIFSQPEIAIVGLREKDADGKVEIKVSKFPVSANGRATTLQEREGFAKIIADREGKILGVAIVAHGATEMIMEGVMAVKYGLKVEQLESLVHPHPTMCEVVHGAVEGILGEALHI